MFCSIPNDFLLPDGKNSRLSQIVNMWTFDRLTPDGNEGVGLKIAYLECANGTRHYIINQVNGNINAIHDDNIELTEFKGCFSPFNLNKLESEVCRLTDLDKSTHDVAALQQLQQHQAEDSGSNSGLQSLENLTQMGF